MLFFSFSFSFSFFFLYIFNIHIHPRINFITLPPLSPLLLFLLLHHDLPHRVDKRLEWHSLRPRREQQPERTQLEPAPKPKPRATLFVEDGGVATVPAAYAVGREICEIVRETFLMKHERSKRAKRNEWNGYSLAEDVSQSINILLHTGQVCSTISRISIAARIPQGSLASLISPADLSQDCADCGGESCCFEGH